MHRSQRARRTPKTTGRPTAPNVDAIVLLERELQPGITVRVVMDAGPLNATLAELSELVRTLGA